MQAGLSPPADGWAGRLRNARPCFPTRIPEMTRSQGRKFVDESSVERIRELQQ